MAGTGTWHDRLIDPRWTRVDRFLNALGGPVDPVLEGILESSRVAGLPDIQVTPSQGRLLQMLARSIGARSILEVGTLGGYSTVWLARALPPEGRLLTLEADPRHAEVARANFRRAGVEALVELLLGPAEETLPRLRRDRHAPFDFAFLDSEKRTSLEQFRAILELSHPGSLIVADNVVRDGALGDPESTDARVLGVRRMVEYAFSRAELLSTVVQTVGSKGYDGMLLSQVR